MEEGFNGVKKREKAKLFVVAAEDWLAMKSLTHATSSMTIERHNLKTRLPRFGRQLVTDNRGIRCEHVPDGPPASRGLPKNCQSRDRYPPGDPQKEIEGGLRFRLMSAASNTRRYRSCFDIARRGATPGVLRHQQIAAFASRRCPRSKQRNAIQRNPTIDLEANRFGFRCAYCWQEHGGRRH
jgi:hypothetical protein